MNDDVEHRTVKPETMVCTGQKRAYLNRKGVPELAECVSPDHNHFRAALDGVSGR